MSATLDDLRLALDPTADRSHPFTPRNKARERMRAEPVTTRLGRAWVALCYCDRLTMEQALAVADVDCSPAPWGAWHAAAVYFGTVDCCWCATCRNGRPLLGRP